MRLTDSQMDRALGAVLGSAAGDALGAGYEFGPPIPITTPVAMAGGGNFSWKPGEWTDDTSMAVPILQELAAGQSLESTSTMDRIVQVWAQWAATATDVGVQTFQLLDGLDEPTATAAWAASSAMHERTGRTGGNGSLMRTGPVALGYLDDGQENALARVTRSISELTHWDPDAGDACVLWTGAIRQAIRTGELDLTGQLALLPADRRLRWSTLISQAERSQPADFDRNGWVVQALQGAWSAIHHGDGLVEILEGAVRGGRDTDTVAAIAGSLAGAVHGASAVPAPWRDLMHGWPGLDAAGLVGLATSVVGR